MAALSRGKLVFLILWVLFVNSSSAVSATEVDEQELSLERSEMGSLLKSSVEVNPQEAVLSRLEEIVRNLTEIVSRLEPILSKVAAKEKEEEKPSADGGQRVCTEEAVDRDTKTKEVGKATSVTKYSPFWSERFPLVSAVRLTTKATCINVLPFRDQEGVSKYVAVGDGRGKVLVFLRNGDVMVEFYSQCDSPITAIVSYSTAHKNESYLLTGHSNGAIMMHRVSDSLIGDEMTSFSIENVGRLFSPDTEEESLAVSMLEVHQVGRMRYILSSDSSGRLMVFKENGTFHGSVMPSSKPLAFLKQRLLFLTENGAGSVDIRTMKLRETECEGMNYSFSRYYVFDATERSKAYGYTSDGDLIHVLLLGDVMNFKCRVRSKRKIEMGDPLALQAIKGYLLVANEEKVFVFNVSSHQYVRVGGPRLLYSVGLDEIRMGFLSQQDGDGATTVLPLSASDRERLFILSLGSGYVGIFRSNLPLFKGEFNSMLWTSPVLVFLVFLFGAWQFFAKKKEALTSWGPDDPFNTSPVVQGQPLASSSGDRLFMDSSSTRAADVRDIRSGALRVPSRRYGSPPGFSRDTSTATSYRPAANDSNVRPTSVDQTFRPADLKYRGPSVDPQPFPKRRDALYINNQSVHDNH